MTENFNDRILLMQKIDWLISNGIRRVAVIFRGIRCYSKSWNIAIPRFKEANVEIYVFEVPTSRDGGFSSLIYPFLLGANKVIHKRNRIGRAGEIPFLERTWELKPLRNASNGLANYNGMNRKDFLRQDGRISAIYPFSKWDKIVQANEFCVRDLNIPDLRQVIHLKKAFSHFF